MQLYCNSLAKTKRNFRLSLARGASILTSLNFEAHGNTAIFSGVYYDIVHHSINYQQIIENKHQM